MPKAPASTAPPERVASERVASERVASERVASERTAPLTDALAGTLRDEAEALGELGALLQRQLDALRAGTPGALEDTVVETHECAAALEALRQKRARQTRLLARVLQVEPTQEAPLRAVAATLQTRPDAAEGRRLAEARGAVQDRAEETHRRGETLRFALEYAADLNRDLLLAMRGAGASGTGNSTYTAAGHSHAAASGGGHRSFVNAIG